MDGRKYEKSLGKIDDVPIEQTKAAIEFGERRRTKIGVKRQELELVSFAVKVAFLYLLGYHTGS